MFNWGDLRFKDRNIGTAFDFANLTSEYIDMPVMA
jgi:hypothetical protein